MNEILDNEYMRLKENMFELADYFENRKDYTLADKMYEEIKKLTKAYRLQKEKE